MIMTFDVAKEESALYDESQVPTVQSFQDSFRGWRIVSEDPLVIEFYTNQYQLDAEEAVGNGSSGGDPCAYPNDQSYAYAQGTASWPMMSLGILAEANGEATFGPDKANLLEVDRMSYIGGPTLEILAGKLISATEENYIPFAPTMGQYVTAEEAATRWANYSDWFRRKDHLWVGTGPYYLENAFHVEGTAILKHNPYYLDPADKWAGYASPMLAEVEIDGPGQVAAGDEATYDVYITFEGAPYPLDSISEVKYLVFDATGELAFSGEAEAVEDGLYQVVLSGDQTSGLDAGANKLQAVVVSSVVSIPTFEAFEFVVR
jgi:peptide/nickel transport system substrate-binding protein